MKKILITAAASCLLFSACNQRMVDFTIISTKNIDLSKSAGWQKGKTRAQGNDKVHIIVFIPTGLPDMKNAIDKAIEKIPGCVALLDGVVYSKYWWVPYIYGQSSYVVEGTPLIDPSLVVNGANELPDYANVIFDRKGQISEVKEISKEDYLTLKGKISKSTEVRAFKNSEELN